MFPTVGAMPMPAGFRYADVYMQGRPRHGSAGRIQTYDAFYRKHPPMDRTRRAKIFAPFDALRGFQDAIASKRVLYESRRELTEGEKEDLDRRLETLYRLTANGRLARENRVTVTVTRFVPCGDPEHEAFGKQGKYESVTGIVQKVDPARRVILLDSGAIPAEDVAEIRSSVFTDDDGSVPTAL